MAPLVPATVVTVRLWARAAETGMISAQHTVRCVGRIERILVIFMGYAGSLSCIGECAGGPVWFSYFRIWSSNCERPDGPLAVTHCDNRAGRNRYCGYGIRRRVDTLLYIYM